MDEFHAAIRSNENKNMIKHFALDKFQKIWPKHRKEIVIAVDLYLDSIIETFLEFSKWSLTAKNVSDMNIDIYKTLKTRVESALDGQIQDASQLIDQRFQARNDQTTSVEERADYAHQERSSFYDENKMYHEKNQ